MRSISRTRRVASAFLAAFALIAFDTAAQAIEWRGFPNMTASDVGVGPKGEVWVIGTDSTPTGSSIYRLQNGKFVLVPGGAVRIDVGPGGPWIVDKAGLISHWNGNGWTRVAGVAKDVGIGGGRVWVIGANNDIHRYTGSTWEKIPGSALRIDVDAKGNAWVVNTRNELYHYNGSAFVRVAAPPAVDVGVGADGTVCIAGTDGLLHKRGNGSWTEHGGGLADVTRTNVVLIAHVDTYASLAHVKFELGKDPNLATTLPVPTIPPRPQAGILPSRASPGVALEPNTTYYYRATVTNKLGVSTSKIASFKTAP